MKCFHLFVKLLLHFRYVSVWTNIEGWHLYFRMKNHPRFVSFKISACLYIMAFSEFLISLFIAALPLYHGIIGIPKSPFILARQSITALFHSRSSFILARLCITASSVLPYHRLFRFRHSITASVFISYHRISRNCGLYRLNHLSWLFSYSSSRCILASVSCFNEPKSTSAR